MNGVRSLDDLRGRDLNLLLVLRILLQTSSVSKAAAMLNVSQSSVSKSLERLRHEFNDPLLVRTSNRMFLTERARQLVPIVETALDSIDQVFDEASTIDPRTSTRLTTIGANEYMQVTLGTELICQLQGEAPAARIHLRPIASNVAALLADGTLDLVIGTDTHESRGLRTRVLYGADVVCVAGRQWPRAASPLSLDAFVGLPQVDVSPSGLGTLPRLMEQQLFRKGEVRNVVCMVSSYLLVPALLARIDAIALVPRPVFDFYRFAETLHIVELAFPAPVYEMRMYWHNVTHGDPYQAWIRDRIASISSRAPSVVSPLARSS